MAPSISTQESKFTVPSLPLNSLADLHWLPVEQRLIYKLCLIVYKIIHDKAPKYLTDLIELYIPGYSGLRSSTQELLQERISKNQWGDRSFWVAAPILWNNLPCHVKSSNSIISFKKNLKTHLFLEAFNSTTATAKFAYDLTESYGHVTPGEQRNILMVNRDLGSSTNGHK